MDRSRAGAAVAAMRRDFVIELAETPAALQEVFRLRYQVYCLERNFEPAQGGLETDEFDPRARHVLVRSRSTGQPVGTVRLVPGRSDGHGLIYPMQHAADLPRLWSLPADRTAEVSRFAISKTLRTEGGGSASLLRLCLMRGIVLMSGHLGLTHWCALMEPALLRLLQFTAIYFQPIGPLVDHHGMRQPSIGRISSVLGRMNQDCPEVWSFVTANGSLWHDDRIEREVQPRARS